MTPPPAPTPWFALTARWLAVGLPLAWGVWQTVATALALFR